LEEGMVLRKAIAELDPAMQSRIAAQLDVQLKESGRTPTYMPAVLVNLANNPELGAAKEERLSKAITIGLPFITRVLEQHRELMAKGEIDSTIPLNFNAVAGVAKNSPYSLKGEFTINQEGSVLMDFSIGI
ncbi:MAG: hypothetical protein K2X08_02390, partial [Chlamydiales bacterium]|nr:hypothetical protein [Chlamydiales bacterium]